jgi:hypothetical protein|tara:strand:- start:77 stop:358 length:282 start_codon:yes stop_codon:yes gene_type:complete
MEHGMQKVCVVVKSLGALKNQKIACEVSCEEQNEECSGQSNDNFFSDRGVPELANGACGLTHKNGSAIASRSIKDKDRKNQVTRIKNDHRFEF